MKNFYFMQPLLIFSFILISCSHQNRSIINGYISAHNSHDINRSLSYYSDDISFELVRTWVKHGKNEIRNLEEWDAALNSKLNFYVTKESGDTLFCKGTEQNEWFKGVGIDKIDCFRF